MHVYIILTKKSSFMYNIVCPLLSLKIKCLLSDPFSRFCLNKYIPKNLMNDILKATTNVHTTHFHTLRFQVSDRNKQKY